MQSNGFVYLNGHIIPAEQAAISPFDVGLLRGYAVFDLLQTVGGKPFQLVEHLERFRSSAALLGLEVPATNEEITRIVLELLERNGHDESTVRLVLSGGESPDGMHFDASTPTFLIITHPMFAMPEQFYYQGAQLLALEHRRELPAAKSTNSLTWLRNHQRLEETGAVDLLYHADGYVSEAATASFYIVRDGRIYAPDSGVMHGTIGTLVLELAQPHHEVVWGPITMEQALAANEAFITSSIRAVVPIVRIDDHVIGDGTVGPVVRTLMTLCNEAMSASGTA